MSPPDGGTVLARALRGTAVARAAVAGLTLGLSALAVLALLGTARTTQTTAWVRSADQVSEYWSRTFLLLTIEGEALNDYVEADSAIGRDPLASAVGSAQGTLHWLTVHGSTEDRAVARSAQDTYGSYTEMLKEFVQAGSDRDRAEVALEAEPVALAASSLREQAVAQMTRKRLDTYAYLSGVEVRAQQLRLAAVGIGVLDLLMLLLCAMVLLSHQRRTERQAVRDSLTGLANRVLLADRMQQAVRAADRHAEPVGLLLLDLNKFKEVNDSHGHHTGDLLLQRVAGRLREVVRDEDTVARLGGDEFAVLLPRAGSVEHVREVAERVLAALQVPADLEGITVDVRASVGAAVYPGHSADAEELMQHADTAMYQAKRGRLGTAVYEPAPTRPRAAEPILLPELRRAIEERELILHYQPKERTDSGRVCGVEALVRWEHPLRGLLAPAAFLPVAEAGNLIHALTDHVLAVALAQHRAWRLAGLILPVSVNITAHSLLDSGFPPRVAALLAQHQTRPDQLTLELTQTAASSGAHRAGAVLGRLHDIGVRLSIDDFGAGYSSMAHLQSWQVDELKIDRKITGSAGSSPANAAVVEAIMVLARASDLDVVAQGIEDQSTLETMETMGCTAAQGFHLCRPLPAPALTEWLAGQPPPLHSTPDLAVIER